MFNSFESFRTLINPEAHGKLYSSDIAGPSKKLKKCFSGYFHMPALSKMCLVDILCELQYQDVIIGHIADTRACRKVNKNKNIVEFVKELRILSPENSFSVHREMEMNKKLLDNADSLTGIGIPHQRMLNRWRQPSGKFC